MAQPANPIQVQGLQGLGSYVDPATGNILIGEADLGFVEVLRLEQQRLAADRNARLTSPVLSAASSSSGLDEFCDDDDPRAPGTYIEPELDTHWRIQQRALNEVLTNRNHYTWMPSTWKMHLRGIPLPDGLWYQQQRERSVRPRVYCRNPKYEFQGVIMFRKLIEVHSRIRDIRELQKLAKAGRDRAHMRGYQYRNWNLVYIQDIRKHVLRCVRNAIEWSRTDGGLKRYNVPPVIKAFDLVDIESVADVYGLANPNGNPDPMDFIERHMCAMADDWNRLIQDLKLPLEEERPTPPVVFGFFAFKHILFIVTKDAADPGAFCDIPCQLNMGEKNQDQWNSVAILGTICWARDHLLELLAHLPVDPMDSDAEDDPDA
ncbi:hypothetical protein F5Y15DRAFT_429733 [Xylariaceae sp. FL0016]|nr:hypothetical protein F5Y15DRAFT_429733 [Xylariaceae sp. FL0016]